jgi:hypothetical protein
MKKCMKCKLTFHFGDRLRCLYCDSILVETSSSGEEKFGAVDGASVMSQFVRDRKLLAHGRMQYIVGSYFKTRTFHFMYAFSRNEFKIGKEFKRFFIQPLNMTSFLVIPWVVFNFLDSLTIRLTHHGFCEDCGWKYKKVYGKVGHDPRECEYCQEYMRVINDIVSGRITATEDELQKQALEKMAVGKRSAYKDLCSRRSFFSAVLDVTVIWVSIWLIIIFLVWVVFPSLYVMTFRMEGDKGSLNLR